MRTSKRSIAITAFLAVAVLTAAPGYTDMVDITATVTADNHYALYHGLENGDSLAFVGRNEVNKPGDPGQYNWSLPETFNFSVQSGEYLYLAGWGDDTSAEGVLGQFDLSTSIISETILTGDQGWEV